MKPNGAVKFKGKKVKLTGNFSYSTKCDVKIETLITKKDQDA